LRDRRTGSRWWYLALLLPLIGLLWVPFYARQNPELWGIPFFYWYQFAWVPLSVAITYLVYVLTRTRGVPPEGRAEAPPIEAQPGRPTPGVRTEGPGGPEGRQ
jgi:Protein of unknown function (DUF3311)